MISRDDTSLIIDDARLAWISDPWYLVRQTVLGALLRRSYEAVAKRRPAFAALTNGVDRGLTLEFESSPWQESRKAALRVVITGRVMV